MADDIKAYFNTSNKVQSQQYYNQLNSKYNWRLVAYLIYFGGIFAEEQTSESIISEHLLRLCRAVVHAGQYILNGYRFVQRISH